MANALMYPKNTETRRKMRLDGLWKFKFDPEDIGTKNQWQTGLIDVDWMPVPSSFNDLYTSKDIREYSGALWYETEVIIPKEWAGKDLDLRFSSVTHHAIVYINGKKVTEHSGGYTPFNAAIQEVINFNQKNQVVVRVSNELSETTLPSGSTENNLAGKQTTTTPTDFFNYSGIQRSVDLVATPKKSIQDVSFHYEIDREKNKAFVHYNIQTSSEDDIVLEMYDQEMNKVAVSDGNKGRLEIENVQLWQPLAAYLYSYKVLLKSGEEILDSYGDQLGIRTVEIKEEELLINGESIYLKGYVKPEKSEMHGAGSNLAVTKRDFELMKWNGANVFRTSQFPHDEEVYRLADQEGFLIMNELPAFGMEVPKPNRFQPNKGQGLEPYFERESVQTVTKDHHLNVLQELIERDKNYASVIAWSVMNEPDTVSDEFKNYAQEIIGKAKTLDPQARPTTILFNAKSLDEKPQLAELVDILAINEYYGWDDQGGYELSDAEEELSALLETWQQWDKPILITGYGAEALQGEMKLPSVQWSEDYQTEVFNMQHKLFDQYPAIRGEFVWSFSDYQTPEGLTAIDGNNSGVFTDNRQPKIIAYLLKDRWDSLEKE